VAAGRLPVSLIEASHARIRAAREALGRREAGAMTSVAPECPEPRAGEPERSPPRS
jgi:hypothetical protein